MEAEEARVGDRGATLRHLRDVAYEFCRTTTESATPQRNAHEAEGMSSKTTKGALPRSLGDLLMLDLVVNSQSLSARSLILAQKVCCQIKNKIKAEINAPKFHLIPCLSREKRWLERILLA